MTIAIGTVLIHPVHGEGVVTAVRPRADELINGEFVSGYEIHLRFNRLISGISWRERVNGEFVSKLVFHSGYLGKLEIKES